MMEKLIYTWDQLHADTIKICNWVKECGFKPDGIIGIARGGVVPATIASHFFDVNPYYVHWSLRDGKVKDMELVKEIAIKAAFGKRLLLIDDIVDSGETILELRNWFSNFYTTGNNVLYTSLFYNIAQPATMHFYVNTIDRTKDKRWVQFPFEI